MDSPNDCSFSWRSIDSFDTVSLVNNTMVDNITIDDMVNDTITDSNTDNITSMDRSYTISIYSVSLLVFIIFVSIMILMFYAMIYSGNDGNNIVYKNNEKRLKTLLI